VFILERDGSLRHYPPGTMPEGKQQAELPQNQKGQPVTPSRFHRIRTFMLGLLGLNPLEMQPHDQR
jgi:hypothetical protein